ncbi:copper chaperone CopZ [Niallia oryzisoli]|uniref:copper chaperone CopZ n=1 Tax=Niallia oryzisoli TaxID=1737571 RepID=UPI0037365CCA
MNQVTLHVQGMSCSHCVHSIEGNIGKLNGIESVIVYFNEGKVNVTFDSNEVDLKDITDTIEDQRFDVKGWELSKPYIM